MSFIQSLGTTLGYFCILLVMFIGILGIIFGILGCGAIHIFWEYSTKKGRMISLVINILSPFVIWFSFSLIYFIMDRYPEKIRDWFVNLF